MNHARPGRLFPFTIVFLLFAASGRTQQETGEFLSRYCIACHNEKLRTANLNLKDYAANSPEVWRKIYDRLKSRSMPPPGLPAPKADELASMLTRIDALTGDSARNASSNAAPDPGRVTARRLNRLEYANTVRDLLRVKTKLAEAFPADDSGYGFDNIGDVLSLSPMLMEKYMAAAKRLSRLAVYGDPLPSKPTTLAHYLAKRSQDTQGTLNAPNIFPFSLRGALYGTHVFPWDAEYEFRFRVVNFRYVLKDPKATLEASRKGALKSIPTVQLTPEQAKKAFPPVDVYLTIDDTPVKAGTIEGTLAVEFDRGDIVARLPVTAGEHRIRVSFPVLADLQDPRDNVNVDLRRKLWVDYLDIAGPFHASGKPPESYNALFTCGHAPGAHRPECARRILRDFASRAYRRPVTDREVQNLLKIASMARSQGEPFEEGIRLAVQAVLVSPHFLYRIERDARPADAKAAHPVNDYELASRLSYFLWSSMPDAELFRLAGEGELRQPGVLATQARRMLADPKSSALVDGFAAQWLQLRSLDRARPDARAFPTVDEELIDDMRQETKLFVQAVIREDRSVLDFLDAPFTFLNGPLARHYGIPNVNGEEFRRVSLAGTKRAGLVTQASLLTVSSYPTRTSPVRRGKWVLETILGAAPPPPPPDVPALKEEQLGATSLRQQLEQHRADPSCAVCHSQMDPIGFGLEGFDAVGAARTHDGKFPIDDSGVLPGGTTFRGAGELIAVLKSRSDVFVGNVSERLLTYALGRGLERYDAPAVERIGERTAQNGNRFSAMVLEIVNSAPFRMRRGDGGSNDVK